MEDVPVGLRLPFTQRWVVQNSPARRVPSHATELLGSRYAIDFVGVDERNRTAPVRDWRTALATEPPERFFAFGRPILAPADGAVVAVHDGEIDHEARRSPVTLLPYALTQASRLRRGVAAIAGNHVVIEHADSGAYIALVHLRRGSLRVRPGQRVSTGQQIAECGNSGNSTQPHVHVQVTDSPFFSIAKGIPLAFHGFREWPRGGSRWHDRDSGLPDEASVVEPLPDP